MDEFSVLRPPCWPHRHIVTIHQAICVVLYYYLRRSVLRSLIEMEANILITA